MRSRLKPLLRSKEFSRCESRKSTSSSCHQSDQEKTMLEFEVEKEYAFPAEVVWRLAGDFGGLQAWMPGVLACRVVGEGAADQGGNAERIVDVFDGSVTRERLEVFDEAGRSYRYSILEARGFDGSSEYFADFSVTALDAGRCVVRWGARFGLPAGIPAEKGPRAAQRAADLYRLCLQNLDVVLGQR
jgi:hypothetical protein